MLRARAPRRLPGAFRRGLTFWRRSILARVVASTVILTALVIAVVGWLLLQQTRDGLLDDRIAAVTAEAADEVDEATKGLAQASGQAADPAVQRYDLTTSILARGHTRGYGVVVTGPAGNGVRIADAGTGSSSDFSPTSVPLSLERHFERAGTSSAWAYTSIARTDGADKIISHQPGIAVGAQVQLPSDGSFYTIYFLFPLDEQQDTMALVTRALLTAGVLMLVLVAGVSWLVTRQVVTPVRMARRVAERLAAGQLQERLRVTGEDDLARLATSFNQMASNLQRQIRQLEELSRVQRRFVSDVSHELRTPLTTVRMAGDVLHDARRQFDPAAARAAELLQTELDRFETLLVDLLEISRFDAGAAVLETDDVNLIDVAHRIVDSTRALAEQRNVALEVEAPDHPCLAEADVRRVERVVRNLVTNAVDHAHPDGDRTSTARVVIKVAGDDQAAAIAVRDHGVGLAPGESAMVFNRFWRADPARARSSGGTGLGLSISMEDTHLHGGWLQAWGRPGEGSQFRLTLPRRVGGSLRQSPLPLVPEDAPEPVR